MSELKLATGDCLGDASDPKGGPLSQLWERTGDDIVYHTADPSHDPEQAAWRAANNLPTTRQPEPSIEALGFCRGWTGSEVELRRKAKEHVNRILADIYGASTANRGVGG